MGLLDNFAFRIWVSVENAFMFTPKSSFPDAASPTDVAAAVSRQPIRQVGEHKLFREIGSYNFWYLDFLATRRCSSYPQSVRATTKLWPSSSRAWRSPGKFAGSRPFLHFFITAGDEFPGAALYLLLTRHYNNRHSQKAITRHRQLRYLGRTLTPCQGSRLHPASSHPKEERR